MDLQDFRLEMSVFQLLYNATKQTQAAAVPAVFQGLKTNLFLRTGDQT